MELGINNLLNPFVEFVSQTITFENDQSTLQQTRIILAGMSGTLYWGNGDSDIITSGEQIYTKDYSSTGTYQISFVGELSSLTKIQIGHSFISGDIADLSILTGLITLANYNANMIGDILVLSNFPSLTSANLNNTNVSGDISDISSLTGLTVLVLGGTNVTGNVSAVSNMTSLTSLNMNSTSVNGNLSVIANLTSLVYLYLFSTSIADYTTSDLDTPDNAMRNLYNMLLDSTEVDNFIIDAANWNGSTYDAPSGLDIDIDGTNAPRTSASDAAVNAIIAVGGTVTANE